MPIAIFVMWAGSILGLAYNQDLTDQKINEMCLQKFNTMTEISECKQVLRDNVDLRKGK